MIHQARLPLNFWAEACNTAVYLHNRSPTTALKDKTPFECLFGEKPDISNLRVFGCICYVHIPDCRRKKLDPKSNRAIFIGYPHGTKGYKLYNLEKKQFQISRNVILHEDKFHHFDGESKSYGTTQAEYFTIPEADEQFERLTQPDSGVNESENNHNVPDTCNPEPVRETDREVPLRNNEHNT